MTFAVRSATDHAADAELITAVRGGDRAAYAVLYERHRAAAYHLARQLVHSPSEADDLVSDAFVKVFNTLLDGRGPDAAFRAYLLTSVRNTFYDSTRRDKKVSYTDDMESHDEGLPFIDTAIAGLDSSMAARAFSRLPERWQTVLWHTEIEGESPAEVARILGMTANGVSALAYRAREGLRQAFLQEHIAEVGADECRLTNDRLGSWARGGLSKREKAQVDRHLEVCDRCAAVAAEIADLNSGLRGVVAALAIGGPTLTAAYLTGGTGAKMATLTWAGATSAQTAGFAKVAGLLSGSTAAGGSTTGVTSGGGLTKLFSSAGNGGLVATVAAAAAAAVIAAVVIVNVGDSSPAPSANDAGLGVVNENGQVNTNPNAPTVTPPEPVTAGTAGTGSTTGTGATSGAGPTSAETIPDEPQQVTDGPSVAAGDLPFSALPGSATSAEVPPIAPQPRSPLPPTDTNPITPPAVVDEPPEPPVVEPPVVEPPVVEPPVVDPPVVEPPVVEPPVVEPPVEEPAVEEPVNEPPVVDEPVEEPPVFAGPEVSTPSSSVSADGVVTITFTVTNPGEVDYADIQLTVPGIGNNGEGNNATATCSVEVTVTDGSESEDSAVCAQTATTLSLGSVAADETATVTLVLIPAEDARGLNNLLPLDLTVTVGPDGSIAIRASK